MKKKHLYTAFVTLNIVNIMEVFLNPLNDSLKGTFKGRKRKLHGEMINMPELLR